MIGLHPVRVFPMGTYVWARRLREARLIDHRIITDCETNISEPTVMKSCCAE